MKIYMLTTIEAMAKEGMFKNQALADAFVQGMEERETLTGVVYYIDNSVI